MTRCQADEVLVDLQPRRAALLGVELGGHQVVLGVDATEGDTVLRYAANASRVFRRDVVTVHEVEIAVLGNASQHWVLIVEPNVVPSHVGNLQSWRQQLGILPAPSE